MTKKQRTRILLRACPRCQGDLFPDMAEGDFACLQCARRFAPSALEGIVEPQAAKAALARAA